MHCLVNDAGHHLDRTQLLAHDFTVLLLISIEPDNGPHSCMRQSCRQCAVPFEPVSVTLSRLVDCIVQRCRAHKHTPEPYDASLLGRLRWTAAPCPDSEGVAVPSASRANGRASDSASSDVREYKRSASCPVGVEGSGGRDMLLLPDRATTAPAGKAGSQRPCIAEHLMKRDACMLD